MFRLLMIVAASGCVYVQSAAVKDAEAKPSGLPWPYGNRPYGGYNRYTGTPYGNGFHHYYGGRDIYATTSAVIMGPYGPYVNGRPVNGGYNPYRRTSTTPMYRPTTTMGSYVVSRPVPRPLPSVCSYNGKTYKKGETFFKGCTAKCTCLGGAAGCVPVCPMVRPGCGGGRKMSGYEMKPVAGSKCTCKVPKCVVIGGIIMPTRLPLVSAPVFRPASTRVIMGPYGPYVNGRPVNGGYNPYRRTSTAIAFTAPVTSSRVNIGPYGPYGFFGPGYNPYRRTTSPVVLPPPVSSVIRRTSTAIAFTAPVTSSRVNIGPYGPYGFFGPGYNPYRRTTSTVGYNPYRRTTSTAIALPPPASSDTRFIGIPSSLVPYPLSVVPPKPDPVGGKCGGTFKVSKKGTIIKSPSFNYHYPRFARCVFKFKAPKGKRVKITFLKMNMEGGKKCLFDSVTIMEKGKKVAKICGNTERGYTLKGGAGTIIFRSDGSVQKNGWRAKLTAV